MNLGLWGIKNYVYFKMSNKYNLTMKNAETDNLG